MKSRRHASVSRQLSFAFLTVIFLLSMITFGWARLSVSSSAARTANADHPAVVALSTKPALATNVQPTTGPSAVGLRSVGVQDSGQLSLTPHLVNLTKSTNTTVRSPFWSPKQDLIAFLANGVDQDQDGFLDTQNQNPDQFTLYTIPISPAPGTTGLLPYATGGSVQGLTWRTDGNLIYVSQLEGTNYTIRSVDPVSKKVSDPIYTTNNPIGAMTISPNNTIIYFEANIGGMWNIFQIPSTAQATNATPMQLTNSGNNRHPSIGVFGASVLLLFDSDRSGLQAAWVMSASGGNQAQLTFPGQGDADSQPQLSIDNQYIVFSSNRLTTNWSATTDTTRNSNIWVAKVDSKSATLLVDAKMPPMPRFYIEATVTSNQSDPAVQVSTSNPFEMLFISDNGTPGSSDLYKGAIIDTQAPYVTATATVVPKVQTPGQLVTVTIPVVDADTGVRHVWLQVKSPDHPIMMPALDIRSSLNMDDAWQPDPIKNPDLWVGGANTDDAIAAKMPWTYVDEPTQIPVEFQILDPGTNTLVPAMIPDPNNPGNQITQTKNFPDYYAFATSDNTMSIFRNASFGQLFQMNNSLYPPEYCQEGSGYPEVPSYWIEMHDDDNTGTYTCQWRTPSTNMEGDWYFDVIVEDSSDVQKDSAGDWHGYRRRFDNIGGCSTIINFPGGHRVLFVDEYGDGQRFMYYGVNGSQPCYNGPCFLSTAYYFMPQPANTAYVLGNIGDKDIPSPLASDGEFGGSDFWRIICRGPVTDDILNSYLPTLVAQKDPNDGHTPVYVRHGEKEVDWLSPSSWYRLVAAWGTGTVPTGTGSMLEQSVQTQLDTFVSNGGRLFAIGFDLPTGLTLNNTAPSSFMQKVFGTDMSSIDSAKGLYISPIDGLPAIAELWPVPPGHNTYFPGIFAQPGWFGNDLPSGYQDWPNGYCWSTHSSVFTKPPWHPETPDHYGRNIQHDHWILMYNSNPNLLDFSNSVWPNSTLTWDILAPTSLTDNTAKSRVAFALWDVAPGVQQYHPEPYDSNAKIVQSPYIVGVSNEYGNNGRTVLWSFGVEQLSARYRNRPLHDGIMWLLDGSIDGTVAQNNGLVPIVGALVTVSRGNQILGAQQTDSNGNYQLKGLRSGGYTLNVIANGYYGVTTKSVDVAGGKVTNDGKDNVNTAQQNNAGNNPTTPNVDFFLYRDPNTSSIWGYVTLHGVAVGSNEVTVTAVPVGGNGSFTATTDANGKYLLTNLPFGPYTVTAVDNITKTTVTLPVSIAKAGDSVQQNIELAQYKPDLLIKKVADPDTAYVGTGIYNATGVNQTVTQTVSSGAVAAYNIKIQNNGNFIDNFTLTAPAGIANGNGWTIAYFDSPANGNDISSLITSQVGWAVGPLKSGDSKVIRVEVSPDDSVPGSTGLDVPINVSDASDPTAVDEVIASTQKAGPLSTVYLTVDPPSPQNTLTPITLTAHAGGGISDVFKFIADDSTIIQDYKGSSSCVWIPTIAGLHTLKVYVRDLAAADPNAEIISQALNYQVNATALTKVQLSVTPASPCFTGTPINLSASTDGGTTLVYKFMATVGTTTTILSDFSTSPTFNWQTATAGTYSLTVEAKDLNAQPVADVVSAPTTYTVNTPPLRTVKLLVSPPSAQLINTPITLTADTNGGGISNNYEFMSGVTILRNYAAPNTFTWTPTSPGTYRLKVLAKDLKGTNPNQEFASTEVVFTIANQLSNIALSVTPSSPRGINTPISLIATAAGGANNQYRYRVNGSIYQDFTSSAVCTWVPTAPGTYALLVDVKDLSGVDPTRVLTSNQVTYIVTSTLSGLTFSANPSSPVAKQTPVTLTVNPVGGANVVYEFLLNGSILRNFTASNTFVWTPTAVGSYQLQVVAEDLSSTPPTQVSTTTTFIVTDLLSKVILNANPSSTRPVNTPLYLSAITTGGANPMYQYFANGLPLGGFSSSPAFQWVPTTAGVYNLYVVAKDLNSANPTTTVTSTSVTVTIANALSAASLITSPASPRPANTPITLTAVAAGGASPAYKFMVTDQNNVQTFLRDYSTSPSCSWTPTTLGSYTLIVSIRDLNGLNPNLEVQSVPVTYIIAGTLSGVSLNVNPSLSCAVNTGVTLTATPLGGSLVSYKFMAGSTVLRDYGTSAAFLWKPNTTGTYQLSVLAKDVNGSNVSQVFTSAVHPFTVTRSLTTVSLLTNPATLCAVNAQVLLTASAVGGANVEYKFMEGSNVIRDFATNPSCTWSPAQTGTYNLYVKAIDLNGDPNALPLTTSALPYRVVSALATVKLTANPSAPQPINTPITLSAQCTGGAALEYRFFVVDPSNNTTLLQDFSAASSYTWRPMVAGTYTLQVAVRDRSGVDPLLETYSTLSYSVLAGSGGPLTVSLSVSPNPGTISVPATLTATAKGATGVQYRFRVGYQDSFNRWRWTDLQPKYGSAASCTWTPTTTNTYTLVAWVLKPGSTNTYDASASQQYIVYTKRLK